MEDNFEIGDWIVSTERYEGLPAGSIGLITEQRDDSIFGCVWNNFEEGNDEVFQSDVDLHNGYYVSKYCFIKIKEEPKRNSLTIVVKRDGGEDSYGFKISKFRSYLYCNNMGDTCLININCGVLSGDWYFRVFGDCDIDRSGLLKIEAILRGLKK